MKTAIVYPVFLVSVLMLSMLGLWQIYNGAIIGSSYRNIPAGLNQLSDAANTAVSVAQKSKNVDKAAQIAERTLKEILEAEKINALTADEKSVAEDGKIKLMQRVASYSCRVDGEKKNRGATVVCTVTPKYAAYQNFSQKRNGNADSDGVVRISVKPIEARGVLAYYRKE